MEQYNNEKKYLHAKKRVEKLKGFYSHFAVYIIVNTFISASKIMSDLSDDISFTEAICDFSNVALWVFWGIGIFFHAFGVFGTQMFLGADWEQKKIQEFMEEEEARKQDIIK